MWKPSGKEAYNYNCKNQLISSKNNTETIDYRYDLQGNVLEAAGFLGKTKYSYNAFNQQTAVLMKDGGIQENRYDAESLRAEVSENGKSSRFLYYNGELLAESEPDETVTSRYILGYGVAAGWQNGREGYHSYHLDEQNSTAYITDVGQRVENSYQYDAFGVIRGKHEGIHNRILYTGQQFDQVTGQYYLRARYYNPVVGRFLQEDIYRGDGLNLYAYCENNPVAYFDPSGYNTRKNYNPDIFWPSKPHKNKTPGHWETIIDQVREWADSGNYDKIYVNKGIKNETGVGSYKNNRPDVMGVRVDGKIDQVEVPSIKDNPADLQRRMDQNAGHMGDRAGEVDVRQIPEKYKNLPLPDDMNIPDDLKNRKTGNSEDKESNTNQCEKEN